MEDQRGILGYRDTQDNLEKVSSRKSELDQQKGRSLDEMSMLVKRLHTKIAGKKAKMAPVLKELRSLRQNCEVMRRLWIYQPFNICYIYFSLHNTNKRIRFSFQEVQVVHAEKKRGYDSCSAGLESNTSRLENEVSKLRKEFNDKESRKYYLNIMLDLDNAKLEMANDDSKHYGKSDQGGEDRKSMR